MTLQELAICFIIMALALSWVFYDLGQTAGMDKIEAANAKERLRVLCIDEPMNAVCATVHKEK